MNILPISLDNLIHARSVESARREFKKTWSEATFEQIMRTICAFANDFLNLNGGYIVVGIEEQNGLPVLPPSGLESFDLDEIQRQIRHKCKERLDPEYYPDVSPEVFQGKQILVIWAPAGGNRPYQTTENFKKGSKRYYVRLGSETVEATDDLRTQLMQLTAKIPFDDRRAAAVSVDVISPALVRNFLSDIKSKLVYPDVVIPDRDLYAALRLTVPVNDHEVPRNVALLFFTNDPEQYFPGARIEIVQFGDDAGGDLIEEKILRGPLHAQLRQALDYLNGLSTGMVRKIPGQAESSRNVAFPYEAMEEAVVNAVYHRSYDGVQEPVKVYLYPDRLEIISYPGPVPGIELRHLQPDATVPPVPNRNRRIGDFLKELALAEGHFTGIPKIRRTMRENGSPDPTFDFDEGRTYFRVILPAHPQYIVVHALREGAHLWAVGERQAAISNLESALRRVPHSGALMAQIIEYQASSGDFSTAEQLFIDAQADLTVTDRNLLYIAIAKCYLDQNNPQRASEVLARAPTPVNVDDLVEVAVLYKRADRLQDAHHIFASNYESIKNDPKATHEYAQTKIRLAMSLSPRERSTKTQLTRDAVELFRRTIQLSNDTVRNAWCWFDLAKALAWLRAPDTEVLQAYNKALELLPHETRFIKKYQEWQKRTPLHR